MRAALCDALRPYNVAQPEHLLDAAFDRDAALLIFDDLDEVPLDRVPGATLGRAATLAAVRDFVLRYGRARALLTCRTRAFDEAAQRMLGWPVETLAPFTLPQIRQFASAWYNELVAKSQIDNELAERLEGKLIGAANDSLRPRTGGVQGTVTASADARIGQAIGVNTGTATYNATKDAN